MPGKRQLAEGDDALAESQTTTNLPRRTRRRSGPTTSSSSNGDSYAARPVAIAVSAAQVDHAMQEPSGVDSDSESSVVSTSSEEPSSDSDEDSEHDASGEGDSVMDTDEITTLPLPPDIEARRRIYQRQAPPTSSLSERLKTFLPQMAAANEELERDRVAGKLAEKSLEAVPDDEEHYIEMNLGLGVLKERDPNKMDSDSESEDEMDADVDGHNERKTTEQDVLGKLMGKKKVKTGGGIQEVPDQ